MSSSPTVATTPGGVPSGLSALFSLSNAAASAPPIPTVVPPLKDGAKDLATGKHAQAQALKHRRLSSTGLTRRRLSDARDAAARPTPASLQTAASALTSLASLSLSAASPLQLPSASAAPVPIAANGTRHTRSRSQGQLLDSSSLSSLHEVPVHASTLSGAVGSDNGAMPVVIESRRAAGMGVLAKSVPTHSVVSASYPTGYAMDEIDVDGEEDIDDDLSIVESLQGNTERDREKTVRAMTMGIATGIVGGGSGGKKGKKRGTIFRCESCSKVYRHPSCLVKHRWEHSPHWREASKFLLSKHQQVQLLEAAAILSHLDPGSSLPEDRSLWPSYLSGGALPPPATVNLSSPPSSATKPSSLSSSTGTTHPVSSSVPAHAGIHVPIPRLGRARSGSAATALTSATGSGPRMHDFTVQGGITQIRPGVLAHPTSTPVQVVSGTKTTPFAPYADDESEEREQTDTLNVLNGSDRAAVVKPEPMAVPLSQGYSGTFGATAFGSSAPLNGTYDYGSYRDPNGGLPGSAYSASGVSYSSSMGGLAASAGAGGWSLPRSDIRSGSVVSTSERDSRSGSRSDDDDVSVSASAGPDEDIDVDVDVDDGEGSGGSIPPGPPSRYRRGASAFGSYGTYGSYESHGDYEYARGAGFAHRRAETWKRDIFEEEDEKHIAQGDEEWEGMEMHMDMD